MTSTNQVLVIGDGLSAPASPDWAIVSLYLTYQPQLGLRRASTPVMND